MAGSRSALYNFSWKFCERISAQVVSLFVSVILARLLSPDDYGIIAMVTVFITLVNVLVSDGFGSALIQKKDADSLDFSSVFYFSIFFSIFLYVLLFFAAPILTNFYGEGYELLTPVIRVLGLRIIITGVNSVQQAYVSRNMLFKRFFFVTLGATVISAVVGIYMAFKGFGVWALVAQYLTNSFFSTLFLGLCIPWRPTLEFSFSRLKGLFSFGSKILSATFLSTLYREIRVFIVGRLYSTDDLAFYSKGKQFPELISVNINSSLTAVLFPRISREQDDLVRVKQLVQRTLRVSAYLLSPAMLGFAAIAKSFIEILLTSKWLPCVPLLQLFCVENLFMPLHSANMQALKAIGKGSAYLKLEVIKKVLELVVLCTVMWFGVNWIVIGMMITSVLFTFINAIPNTKYLNYNIFEQMRDFLPSFLMAVIMFFAVNSLNYLNIPLMSKLILQIFVGVAVYILESVLFKSEPFSFIKNMILDKFKKKV